MLTNFGPTGQAIYERTYSRTKQDGTKETWPDTVRRVVDGNIALAPNSVWESERDDLIRMMEEFKIIPGGRHLWASGVKGRQYLFNCHVAGWDPDPTEHFSFTFLRLMEGGGVGANYSNKYLKDYPFYENAFELHIVCDPDHPDYQEMKDANLLSTKYVSDWTGAFEIEDSREGWANGLTDLIATYYRDDVTYTSRVYDVSRVREKGSRLKTFGGSASGPLPFARMMHKIVEIMNCPPNEERDTNYVLPRQMTGMMAMEIDHAIAECVVSGGNRRSARMSIMHWNDYEIVDFLECKKSGDKHWTTNISVEVDENFWNDIDLNVPDSNVGWEAKGVLQYISEGMLHNGEPGIWDSDYSNEGEPNKVIATNPCGEIALEAWENCNLGHVNLAAFVDDNGEINLPSQLDLYHAHTLMTRFLMRATYGDVNDAKQAETLSRNRRIGVGHFGVASALAMMGIKYSEAHKNHWFRQLLLDLGVHVDEAAIKYAHSLRIPVPVKTRTVAPTGTIAKMPGVSEGIHPIFAKYFIRRIRFSKNDAAQVATIEKYRSEGYLIEDCKYAPDTYVVAIPTKDILVEQVEAIWGNSDSVQAADDLNLDQMLGFQGLYQSLWADNAISYTANITPSEYTPAKIERALRMHGLQLKGATVFPDKGFDQAPYERISQADYAIYTIADGIDENCVSGACPVK